MDILGELPQEIAEMIFEYLRPQDLVNCFRVSYRWQQMVSHDHVWSRHLPYHKYVEKYWEDAVGERYDEGEGCQLMKKYLNESRIKNNMKQGKYNVITSVPFYYKNPRFTLNANELWHTLTDGILLSNGDLLTFKDDPDIDPTYDGTTISSDFRLLAAPYRNFVFIYERKPPNLEFELLSLLAACPATEKKPERSTTSLVCCPKLDNESAALFLREYRTFDILECAFFTGVDSLSERRVCLRLYRSLEYLLEEQSEDECEEQSEDECEEQSEDEYEDLSEDDYENLSEDEYKGYQGYQRLYVLWDIDRNRLVHSWRFDRELRVEEGWDRRGVCVTYETRRSGYYKRIEYYDVDMRPLTVIPIRECHFSSIVMSYNFSVAVIRTPDYKSQLAMWEKDSTEYRVLVEEFTGRIITVSPSTVAYQLDKKTVAIIAAPDWQVVAHVKITSLDDIYDFSLTEFSDGSWFIVKRAEKGYIWQDMERRNTTKISERLIDTTAEHKMILPECLRIVFYKGVKLAIVAHDGEGRLTIIDYDK